MNEASIVFKTPAKVNLGLNILGKREDGFHELETIFQMVNWCDEIKIEYLSEGLDLVCNQPDIPIDDGNLVIKAARLLQTRFPGQCGGAKIHLTKNIPHGAGLGGGSGNAAGVLLALNFLWDLKLKRKDLILLAAELGRMCLFSFFRPVPWVRVEGKFSNPSKVPLSFIF